jgi:nucleotide-binding universal stress UspA family protein
MQLEDAFMYQRILIATDGSELANKALNHGMALAKRVGAPVTVVTVTESWSALELGRMARQGNPNPIAQFEDMARTAATAILDKVKQTAASQGVACDVVHIADKHPAEGIIATAKDKGCDLIVMASHGRRGFDRILLGSQANEVITHSKVPTLIVR